MKEYLKQLFSETGTASIARVLTTLCYITANAIAIYAILFTKEATALVATLLSAGTILKVGQKVVEDKNENSQ